jgi:prepilin-type processing-associated H-X9-DG protein
VDWVYDYPPSQVNGWFGVQDWVTLLIQDNDLPVQISQQFATGANTMQENNCLHCPSGGDFASNSLYPTGVYAPYTHQSASGSGYHQDEDFTFWTSNTAGQDSKYWCWYTLNSMSNPNASFPLGTYPFNEVPAFASGGAAPYVAGSYSTLKITALQPSSIVPMAFDGAAVDHGGCDSDINLRHNNATLCNIVFADGHVESLRGDQLPGGMKATNLTYNAELRNSGSLDTRNSSVHWMLTQ